MKIHSDTAWDIASKFSYVLASETRDLAALVDGALAAERERCAALMEVCKMFTAAAHDARDALNAAGIACPSSIALAAEKARAAIAKAEGR
jgi:hypothetical protein